jgi:hypothetical protein
MQHSIPLCSLPNLVFPAGIWKDFLDACQINLLWPFCICPDFAPTAVSELLYAEAAQSSGVSLKKTPPFIELKRAHEL